MIAIETKYVGPRERSSVRIIATIESGHRVVIPYPYELSGEAAHRKAAVALCQRKFDHRGDTFACNRLIGARTKSGYVFVFAPSSCKCGAEAFRGLRRGRH